jgi:hypothetical protein
MRLYDIIPNDPLLEDLSRRGFLKGIGAAALAGTAGSSKAGIFSSPALFDPGIYKGEAIQLLGSYSDDSSGKAHGGSGGAARPCTIVIEKNKITLTTTTEGINLGTKYKGVDTSSKIVRTWNDYKVTSNSLVATNVKNREDQKHSGYAPDPNTGKLVPQNLRMVKSKETETLTISKDGKFNFTRLDHTPSAEKNYSVHTSGITGVIKTKGDDLK